MNRGAQAMNAFLYSMRLRGLKHGSEEEYDMFEDIAVCRARNRRMNGAAESKLQLEHVGEDHAATRVERDGDPSCAAEQEQQSECCAEDGKHGADEGDRAGTQSGEHHQAPHPSTPTKDVNEVLQTMIQVNGGVEQETKCSKPNDPPQAKPNTLE